MRVSILMAAYNRAELIPAAVESALAQDVDDWELIAIDDGSTDGTWEVLQSYAERDARIRVRRQARAGPIAFGETYNRALEMARGETIAFLDSDDTWPSDKLRRQLEHHGDGGASLSFGRIRYLDAEGRFSSGCYPDAAQSAELERATPRERYLSLLRGEYVILPVAAMVDRDALERIGGFHQPAYMPAYDYPTWLLLLRDRPEGLRFVPEVLGHWRQHSPDQLTWRDAPLLARGALRFAGELASADGLVPPGRSPEAFVMSPARQRWLAGSSYRAALLTADEEGFWPGLKASSRIAAQGNPMLALKATAATFWKTARRALSRD